MSEVIENVRLLLDFVSYFSRFLSFWLIFDDSNNFAKKFCPPNPGTFSDRMFCCPFGAGGCWVLVLAGGVGGGVLFFLLLNGVPKYIISIFGRFEFFQTNHIVLSENLRSKPINRFQPREILDTGIQIK